MLCIIPWGTLQNEFANIDKPTAMPVKLFNLKLNNFLYNGKIFASLFSYKITTYIF